MAPSTCKKCGGSGYLAMFARTDAGRCWACQDRVDTSYTAVAAAMTFEEHEAVRLALLQELKAARVAARMARRALEGAK